MSAIQQHGDRINKINLTQNGLPKINYVKLVRVCLKSEDYAEIEKEYIQPNDKQEGNFRLQLYCLQHLCMLCVH